MSNTQNITHADTTQDTDATDGKTVRPNIEWPVEVWKEVKKASIDANAKSFGQFVVESMARLVGVKVA